MKSSWLLLMAPLLAGCLDFDGAYDDLARRLDAGAADASVPADAGTDDGGAGSTDAGTTDAGTADAGTADAGTADAGTADAGTSDAGTSDAGSSDAGTADAGTADAGPPDAGTTDAGLRCGPYRLALRQTFIDDGGLVAWPGVSASDAGLLVLGVTANGEGFVRQLPAGAPLPLPEQPLLGTGWGGDEFFMLDYGGGGWFRLDAGYSSAMTGPCAGDFAGAVHSPAPGVGVFCDEETFSACRVEQGTASRLAPAAAIAGRLTCGAVAMTDDGGLLRGGAVFPDAGASDRYPLLLGVDGGPVSVPASLYSIIEIAAVDGDEPFVLASLGDLLVRRDGGWRQAAPRDGGSYRSLLAFPPRTVLALGTANTAVWFDGDTLCEAGPPGLDPAYTWNWTRAVRVGTSVVVSGNIDTDAGRAVGAAAVLELVPW